VACGRRCPPSLPRGAPRSGFRSCRRAGHPAYWRMTVHPSSALLGALPPSFDHAGRATDAGKDLEVSVQGGGAERLNPWSIPSPPMRGLPSSHLAAAERRRGLPQSSRRRRATCACCRDRPDSGRPSSRSGGTTMRSGGHGVGDAALYRLVNGEGVRMLARGAPRGQSRRGAVADARRRETSRWYGQTPDETCERSRREQSGIRTPASPQGRRRAIRSEPINFSVNAGPVVPPTGTGPRRGRWHGLRGARAADPTRGRRRRIPSSPDAGSSTSAWRGSAPSRAGSSPRSAPRWTRSSPAGTGLPP